MPTVPPAARPTSGTTTAMSDLIGTEILKLRTVRAPAALAAAGLVVTAFLALQSVTRSGDGAPSIGTAALLLTVLSAAGRAQLLVLVLGVLLVTAERRHGTLTATLLQTPLRARLIAAKATAAAVAGLLVGLATLAVVVLIALGAGALPVSLLNGDVVLAATGQLFAYPLYALLGVGIGSLLAASQPTAVLLPVGWLLLVESNLGALPGPVLAWLPGHLTSALANAGELADLMPVWAGGLGLTASGLLLSAAGAARLGRADIG